MQQVIDTGQCVLDPELVSEDSLGVFGPQTADPIGRCGSSQQSLFEGLLLGHG
jgi:hypothetical protein